MEKDTIYVPLSFEHLFSHIFGKKKYHGFVGRHQLNVWRKQVYKLIKVIIKFINYNIDISDNFHKNDLLKTCNNALTETSRAKTIEEINISLIENLIIIIIKMFGKMPDNWHKKTINRRDYYKLDKYRKIAYIQTSDQKAQLILALCNKEPYKNELYNKFWFDFHKDSQQFVDWFKNVYPKIYMEMF